MIEDRHKTYLETLGEGYKLGRLVLVECKEVSTGEPVVIVCACPEDEDPEVRTMYPVARLFKGEPTEEIEPPEGFQICH